MDIFVHARLTYLQWPFKVKPFWTIHDHWGPFYKRVLAGQGSPKKNWPWMVTLSRPNQPKPTFQEKSDVFILRSLCLFPIKKIIGLYLRPLNLPMYGISKFYMNRPLSFVTLRPYLTHILSINTERSRWSVCLSMDRHIWVDYRMLLTDNDPGDKTKHRSFLSKYSIHTSRFALKPFSL